MFKLFKGIDPIERASEYRSLLERADLWVWVVEEMDYSGDYVYGVYASEDGATRAAAERVEYCRKAWERTLATVMPPIGGHREYEAPSMHISKIRVEP
jgi:hypothetical protein